MPQFAHLKPGSDVEKQFWGKNKDIVQTLLDEVNADIFENKGQYKELVIKGLYLSSTPPIPKENYLCLKTGQCSLCIYVSTGPRLSVFVERYSGSYSWKSIPVFSVLILNKAIEEALKFVFYG